MVSRRPPTPTRTEKLPPRQEGRLANPRCPRPPAPPTNSMQLFNVTGIMISYFVNYGISKQIPDADNSAQWRVPFALQMLPGVMLLLVLTQNESPRWLVEKNRIAEARAALSRVRALPEDDPALQEELREIVADLEGKERLPLATQVRAAFASRKALYQSSIGVVLMFWQQWTGTNSINYYSPYVACLPACLTARVTD